MEVNNRIVKSTYIKLSLRLRSKSSNIHIKYFTMDDFSTILFGTLMFLFTCVFNKNQMNFDTVSKFNLFTIFTILLTLINRTISFDVNGEKNLLFCLVPLSKKSIRQLDIKIEFLSFLKSVILFQTVFVVYGTIKFGYLFFLVSLLGIVCLSMMTYFINIILKIIVLLIGKKFGIIYKIDNYISSIVFTILFYLVNHYTTSVVSLKFLFTNILTKVSNFSPNYSVNLKYLWITVFISLIITLINYFVFTNFSFEKHSKKKDKNIKEFFPKEHDSYQEDSLNGIIDSLIINDSELETAYLEQTLKVFANIGWSIIVLTLMNIFSSMQEIFMIVAFKGLASCGRRIQSLLYSSSPKSLEYFRIFPAYSDKNISKKATLKVFKNSVIFIFIPMIIIIILFTHNDFLEMSVSIITGISIFFGSIYINYKALVKNKPFSYSKMSDKIPEDILSNLFYISLYIYTFVVFAVLDFSVLTVLPILIVFFVPAVLCIFSLLKRIDNNMYPFIKQNKSNESAVSCIKMFAKYYQKEEVEGWNKEYSLDKEKGSAFIDMHNMSNRIGLNLESYEVDSLSSIIGIKKTHPYIAELSMKNKTTYVVVYETQKRTLIIADPRKKGLSTLSIKRFKKYFTGNILANKE